MKLLLALLLAFPSFMTNSLEASVSPMEKAKLAHVTLSTKSGKIFCGGFAVDTNVVATATHCVVAALMHGEDIYFNGKSCDTDTIIEMDYRDHLLVSTCQSYSHTAKLAPLPKVGEHVFVWGHPDGWPLMYREGAVAGAYPQEEAWNETPAGAITTFYDFNLWHGDSGSAIYNEDGEVVGMVSNTWNSEEPGFYLVGSYSFNFSQPVMAKYGVK